MTAPVWRRTRLGPVYAAVLAFGAVAVASLFLSAPPMAVSVTGEVPADLALVVDGAPGPAVRADGPAQVDAGADQLCLSSAVPVRVAGTEPPSACVAATTAMPIRVERMVVRVRSDDRSPRGGIVTIEAGRDAPAERDDLVDGVYRPQRPVTGRTVCFEPPAGRSASGAPLPADRPSCIVASDPLRDIVFEVQQ